MIPTPPPQQKRSTTDTDVRIGKMIAILRRNRRLSQSDMAEKLDVSFQQIQKYEKGRNRISITRFLNICMIIGIKPSDFIKKLEGDLELECGNKVI
ncbi:MAG TPA: helix-turn-helix transcriptional regulator [Alphaproteobacteria bacterium]|nr:helix-turn-helix transcriptional regulator [Alphaproteobacteria bacterium]